MTISHAKTCFIPYTERMTFSQWYAQEDNVKRIARIKKEGIYKFPKTKKYKKLIKRFYKPNLH